MAGLIAGIRSKVLGLFGLPTKNGDNGNWGAVVSGQFCPFLGRKRLKKSNGPLSRLNSGGRNPEN